MAKTFTRPFPQTQITATAVATLAGTSANDTPTNTVLLYTAPADGALITKLTAMPRATVTASCLNVYLSKDGAVYRLKDSALMAAYTAAATTAKPTTTFDKVTEFTPMRLGAGDRIYVQSEVALASGIVFNAEISEFA